MSKNRYQDYVIKEGKLIGEFEEMYRNFDDPWHQSDETSVLDSRRIVAKNWIQRISQKSETPVSVCEIGCGFGFLTANLAADGIRSMGTDVSETAVEKARRLHPTATFEVADFLDIHVYKKHEVNVFLMSEITWYVLPKLKRFIEFIDEYKNEINSEVYLIHLLTTYADGAQTYGREYFTDLNTILTYFDLTYIEYGFVAGGDETKSITTGTYFVAKV